MTAPSPDDFEGWYVVQTRGRSEAAVRMLLEHEVGLEVYLPVEKHLVRHARQTKTVERALIPRHLFAYIKVKGDFYAVKTTLGVTGLLCQANGKPARCVEEELAKLQLMEELGEFDCTPAAQPDFEYGDKVQIAETEETLAAGVAGRTGEFTKLKGKDRAVLLLDAVVNGGRRYVWEVDLATLEAA